MKHAAEWRTKEQVLLELSKAFSFSAESLEKNRKGRLAADQFRTALGRFLRPLLSAAAWIIGPFGVWAIILMFTRGADLGAALALVWERGTHLRDFAGDAGYLTVGACVIATLASIGVGVYHGMKVSFALYFDLVERAVVIKDGRIAAAEDQVYRKGGRDPIEFYFYDMKDERFRVSREAFLALDSGAAYYLYLLPRSRTPVSIEPRLTAEEALGAAG